MQNWEKGNTDIILDSGLGKHYFGVTVIKNREIIIEKMFKSKSQALKFVKSYMRTH